MIFHRSGSPSMVDIDAFSTTYRARLDEAELAKSIPENISLEVVSLFSMTFSFALSSFFISFYILQKTDKLIRI